MPNKFHNGFTCPRCGEHYFSTISLPANFPAREYEGAMKGMQPGDQRGKCTARDHGLNNCDFYWDRNDKAVEEEVFYHMSFEEVQRQIDFSDTVSGIYGCMAYRCREDYRFWTCTDGDYRWYGVQDDFGTLTAVSSYTNIRGYKPSYRKATIPHAIVRWLGFWMEWARKNCSRLALRLD